MANKENQYQEAAGDDMPTLVHKLRVHQAVLQAQNEELKRTQLELEKSRDNYLELYDSIPVGCFTLDEDNSILEVNATGALMLGLSQRELLKSKLTRFLFSTEENQDSFYLQTKESRQTGTPQEGDLEMRRRDGKRFSVHLKIVPVKDNEGQSNQLRLAITDITERKHMGETLAKAKDELEVRVRERTAELGAANAELKLRASLLDKATDAILLRDTHHHLIYVNEAASEMFGYTKEELIGKHFKSTLAPEELPHFDEKTQTILEKGRMQTEACHLRKDNSVFPTEFNSHLIEIGKRQYILSVIRDITERRKSEAALRESEERFRGIYESSPIGIELYDSEGQLFMANLACLDIFGVADVSKVKGFKLFDDPNVTSEVKDKLGKSETVRYEALFDFEKVKALKLYETTKSGMIYLDVVITPLKSNEKGIAGGYLVQVQDITEHKQAEEKIKQSELQFQKLFDAMSEGVALVDTTGRIIKANVAEARMLGLPSPAEREGQYFSHPGRRYIHPDGTPVPPEGMTVNLAMRSKRQIQNMVIGVIREDGSTRWVNVNAVPLIGESGSVTGVVRTLTDITEQKQLREEKEQFTRRLIAVQEEERKRIARELHDDTAQNLALLMLEIDHLLQSKEKLPAKVVENLKKLKEDTDRTQREVRRYSHELRPGVLEHLGLEAALESLADDTNSRGGVRVTLNIDGGGRRLLEEMELALFRIAQEAVNNIWKHAGATQTVINLKYTPQKVRLTIADNGKGFKPIRKRVSGITGGLGLVGMRERAQLIGANLRIKSRPGKGSMVSVETSAWENGSS